MNYVYADFMKIDYENRLILTCRGTFRDLGKQNIELRTGLRLVFYNEDEDINGNRDDLVVPGIVGYDEVNKRWIAYVEWDEIKNVSQLSFKEKRSLGISKI
jgi:hypothetical protein